mgnify:FL=1
MDKFLDTIQENFDKFRIVIKYTFIGCLVAIALLIIFAFYCKTCNTIFKELNSNPQKSIKKIDFLLKIAPKSAFLYYLKGHAYLNLDKYDDSLKYFEKSLEYKEYADTYSEMAVTNFKKEGKITQKVLDLFEKAIKINSSNAGIYQERASVYFIAGEYDKSLNDLEEAYKITQDECFISISADVYLQKGDYCKAYTYYEAFDKQTGHNSVFKDYAKFRCHK